MNSLAAELLFAALKSRLEQILDLADDCNDIALTLSEMGYGASIDEPITMSNENDGPFPSLSITGHSIGCFTVDDSSIYDRFFSAGVLKRRKANNVKQLRVPVVRLRNALGDSCSWTCFYCRSVGDESVGPDRRSWHVDHVYPIAKGGDNQADNLVLSCATCNLAKKHQTANEYFKALNLRRETAA